MIAQVVIAVCGVASIWLSQSPNERSRKWAPVIGLLAQPAWLGVTWESGQWGMFALSLVYTAGWARGIFTYWSKP